VPSEENKIKVKQKLKRKKRGEPEKKNS